VHLLFEKDPPTYALNGLTRDEKIQETFQVMSQIYIDIGFFKEPPPIFFKPGSTVSEFAKISMIESKPLSNKTETGSRKSRDDRMMMML
jgi:hypothetical protein